MLYALEVVLAGKHLGNQSPVVITFFAGISAVIISGSILLTGLRSGTIELPKPGVILIIMTIGAVSFTADWTHYMAIVRKLDIVTLSMFYLLVPVICTAFKLQIPTPKLFVAWVLGGLALYLVALNEQSVGPH